MKTVSVFFFTFVLLLVLKLTGVIAWSWIWVTVPLWVLGILAFIAGLMALCLYKSLFDWVEKRQIKKVNKMFKGGRF